jgi:hypothetical protein
LIEINIFFKEEIKKLKKSEEERILAKEAKRKKKEEAALEKYKVMKGFLSKQGNPISPQFPQFFYFPISRIF